MHCKKTSNNTKSYYFEYFFELFIHAKEHIQHIAIQIYFGHFQYLQRTEDSHASRMIIVAA